MSATLIAIILDDERKRLDDEQEDEAARTSPETSPAVSWLDAPAVVEVIGAAVAAALVVMLG